MKTSKTTPAVEKRDYIHTSFLKVSTRMDPGNELQSLKTVIYITIQFSVVTHLE
ncbi:hypothetical protein [Rhodohalobacter sp.]|uniref:hypothetical protein n=1 Tax=Rhodohalobacter sp. TaxID=1974210 RepID=UPI00356B5092